jgi:hypothetical protein
MVNMAFFLKGIKIIEVVREKNSTKYTKINKERK